MLHKKHYFYSQVMVCTNKMSYYTHKETFFISQKCFFLYIVFTKIHYK
jgi:hypothetical protein